MTLTTLINAVLVGCIYGLIGLSVSLAYGVARLLNWAYGNMFIFLMYIAWTLIQATTMDILTVIPIVVVISICLFFVVQKVTQPYVLAENELGQLIMTLGISQIIYGLIHYIWGPRPKAIFTNYALLSVHVGSVYIQVPYLLVGLAGIIPIILVHIFVTRTWRGKALQATAQNKMLIRVCGISLNSVYLLLILFMGAIAGFAASFLFGLWGVEASDGDFYITLAFVVTLMLGRSIIGALLAGIFVSLAETLAQVYLGGWSTGMATDILFLLLLLIQNVLKGRSNAEGGFA